MEIALAKGSKKFGAALLAALASFLLYLPDLGNGFINWDDDIYVYSNPHIRSFDGSLFKWAFTKFYAANWHPLTWISHALDYAVWGLNPFGHHLTNNVLHAVNAFLVVLLAIRLLEAYAKRKGKSAAGERNVLVAGLVTGLLFGLHPLHVESVAWVAERKDVLCAFFFLLGLLAYVRYAENTDENEPLLKRFSSRSYLLVLAAFLCALMSKPMAVTFPVILLILDWLPFGRIGLKAWQRAIAEKVPFFVASLASFLLTVEAQSSGSAVLSLEAVPVATRLLLGIKAIAVYLWKMAFPYRLVPFYPYPTAANLFSLQHILPVLLVVLATFLFVTLARKNRLWLAAWGYYVVTLLPVLGFIQVGGQGMADRYTYLPGIAPFFMAGLGAAWVFERSASIKTTRVLCTGIAALLFLSMSYLSIKQIRLWKNDFVFWNYMIAEEPSLALPHNNLALAYADKGMTDQAIDQLERAIQLQPGWPVPHYNLANTYMALNMRDRAIAELNTTVTLDPGFAEAHNNLGILYASRGAFSEAIQQFGAAARLQPANKTFRANLERAIEGREEQR
jgi:tetratricopeptide (TPR) repeat protein